MATTTNKTATTTKVEKQPLPGRQTGTKNTPSGKTSAKSANMDASAKAKRDAELEAAKVERERLQQEKAAERVRKADEAEAKKAQREADKLAKENEPKVGDVALEISSALTVRTESFAPSVVAQAMRDTNMFLFKTINDSLTTIGDDQLLDAYAATTDNETASWITRSRIANEIYFRASEKVKKSILAGDTKKAEATQKKAIDDICNAMNIGYSVFMYDVRMWSLCFDHANDNVDMIDAKEMVEAAQLLKHRSYFNLAVDCQKPRTFVRELVTAVNKGEKMTIKIAKGIKDRVDSMATGRPIEDRKVSTVDYLVRVRETQFQETHEAFICGLFNILEAVKSDGKDRYIAIQNGKVVVGEGKPGISSKAPANVYFTVKADGTIAPGIVPREGYEVKFVKTEETPAPPQEG